MCVLTMKTAYLGLGSNVGDREANLRAAIERLPAPDLRVLRVSPVYETEPVDFTRQRWFLNLVVEAETSLFPMQLLARVARIERALGRVRAVPKGPRTIDIDILLYGKAVIQSDALEIPHPRMAERRFVLAPLADLAPDLRHPIAHRTVSEMLDAASPQTVRRVEGLTLLL
jgi:2-amino-4-hydroxy-6-hydroxymethyldihydropteridine diphosphokinase